MSDVLTAEPFTPDGSLEELRQLRLRLAEATTEAVLLRKDLGRKKVKFNRELAKARTVIRERARQQAQKLTVDEVNDVAMGMESLDELSQAAGLAESLFDAQKLLVDSLKSQMSAAQSELNVVKELTR